MSVKERKERERDEKRGLILNAASEIIAEEGMEKLSVRKIAARIEYSPAIIYHYFSDMNEIVSSLMKVKYQTIIEAVASMQAAESEPEKRLKESLRKYIETALAMPEEYKTIMISSSQDVLEHTSVLFQGAAVRRPAIGMLKRNLEELYAGQSIDDSSIELTAQAVWTAAFGLILRLIIEKDISEEQKERLIEQNLKMIMGGLVSLKNQNNY